MDRVSEPSESAAPDGPLVSVVIPTYNRRHLVERAVRSAVAQTYAKVDVCVVDDASTDGTVEALEPLAAEGRIRLERNPTNLGMVANFNRCLELSRGDVVLPLGSDDTIDPGLVAAAVEVFERHRRVGMVLAPVRGIDPNGEVLYQGTERPVHHAAAGDEAAWLVLSVGCPMITTVFRRSCIDQLGGYDEDIWGGPEVEIAVRVAASWEVYDLGKTLGSYGKHAGNLGPRLFRRDGLLESHLRGLEKTWSYLSDDYLRQRGIPDRGSHVRKIAADYGISGAVVNLAAGDRAGALGYLARVRALNAGWWRWPRFWRTLGFTLIPGVGPWIARRRLRSLSRSGPDDEARS